VFMKECARFLIYDRRDTYCLLRYRAGLYRTSGSCAYPTNPYTSFPSPANRHVTHVPAQDNREPLWPSGYKKTTTHGLIASLNQFRNFLVSNTTVNSQHPWLNQNSSLVQSSGVEIVINKGGVISVMNVLGSPVRLPIYYFPLLKSICSFGTWLMTIRPYDSLPITPRQL
jgi:hypothetical protein